METNFHKLSPFHICAVVDHKDGNNPCCVLDKCRANHSSHHLQPQELRLLDTAQVSKLMNFFSFQDSPCSLTGRSAQQLAAWVAKRSLFSIPSGSTITQTKHGHFRFVCKDKIIKIYQIGVPFSST